MADAKRCPVTVPRGTGPADGSFGNGKLRVGGLWPHGVVAVDPRSDFVDSQGRVRMKFPWWRMTRGALSITAHRLDMPAPPAQVDVPDGYGLTGFQASAVTFPTDGCWQLTGAAGQASLTFVTFVIKRIPGP
jgi:hypothetical protein